MCKVLAALRRAGLQVSSAQPNLINFLQSRSNCILDVIVRRSGNVRGLRLQIL